MSVVAYLPSVPVVDVLLVAVVAVVVVGGGTVIEEEEEEEEEAEAAGWLAGWLAVWGIGCYTGSRTATILTLPWFPSSASLFTLALDSLQDPSGHHIPCLIFRGASRCQPLLPNQHVARQILRSLSSPLGCLMGCPDPHTHTPTLNTLPPFLEYLRGTDTVTNHECRQWHGARVREATRRDRRWPREGGALRLTREGQIEFRRGRGVTLPPPTPYPPILVNAVYSLFYPSTPPQHHISFPGTMGITPRAQKPKKIPVGLEGGSELVSVLLTYFTLVLLLVAVYLLYRVGVSPCLVPAHSQSCLVLLVNLIPVRHSLPRYSPPLVPLFPSPPHFPPAMLIHSVFEACESAGEMVKGGEVVLVLVGKTIEGKWIICRVKEGEERPATYVAKLLDGGEGMEWEEKEKVGGVLFPNGEASVEELRGTGEGWQGAVGIGDGGTKCSFSTPQSLFPLQFALISPPFLPPRTLISLLISHPFLLRPPFPTPLPPLPGEAQDAQGDRTARRGGNLRHPGGAAAHSIHPLYKSGVATSLASWCLDAALAVEWKASHLHTHDAVATQCTRLETVSLMWSLKESTEDKGDDDANFISDHDCTQRHEVLKLSVMENRVKHLKLGKDGQEEHVRPAEGGAGGEKPKRSLRSTDGGKHDRRLELQPRT
ncbi:hypothetical protein O3P69_001535 [Scylla paramamosain]|uniref:Uncharacterized protein n=1 Tax=Scylla paramamosain TaxID=85552 RepID=A0AAW0UZ89_SCYPA